MQGARCGDLIPGLQDHTPGCRRRQTAAPPGLPGTPVFIPGLVLVFPAPSELLFPQPSWAADAPQGCSSLWPSVPYLGPASPSLEAPWWGLGIRHCRMALQGRHWAEDFGYVILPTYTRCPPAARGIPTGSGWLPEASRHLCEAKAMAKFAVCMSFVLLLGRITAHSVADKNVDVWSSLVSVSGFHCGVRGLRSFLEASGESLFPCLFQLPGLPSFLGSRPSALASWQ